MVKSYLLRDKVYIRLFIIAVLLVGLDAKVSAFQSSSILDYQELKNIYESGYSCCPGALEKAKDLFTAPTLRQNQASKTSFQFDEKLNKPFVRVSQWNLERGFKLDEIKTLLTNPDQYINENLEEKLLRKQNDKYLKAKEEANLLNNTDILTVNEADLGVNRTQYRNIVAEIAGVMEADYSYVTEFIEIDPKLMNAKNTDPSKYKGLHGNAIISKFPIRNSEAIELPQCYDWYNGEKERISYFEKLRRTTGRIVFNQKPVTEVRLGKRNALVAQITLPNQELVTVVNAHLEDRATPKCRRLQIQKVLDHTKDINTPIVFAGDFNSFEFNTRPTSLSKLFISTIGDFNVVARSTIAAFNPIAFITNAGTFVLNQVRKFKDPTVRNVAVVMPNRAGKMFSDFKDFVFSDGNQIDFSGTKELTYDKRGKLSNSNQRWHKGFVETYQFNRSYKVVRFKPDWILVKPVVKNGQKHFYPAFGRTLKTLNYSYKDYRLTDHSPITAELIL